VFEHSPYEDSTFVVHLALADVANDLNENKIWAFHETLARKARVSDRSLSRAIATLLADGFLQKLESPQGRARRATVYRFLFRPVATVAINANDDAIGRHQERSTVATGDNLAGRAFSLEQKQIQPKGTSSRKRSQRRAEVDETIKLALRAAGVSQ